MPRLKSLHKTQSNEVFHIEFKQFKTQLPKEVSENTHVLNIVQKKVLPTYIV